MKRNLILIFLIIYFASCNKGYKNFIKNYQFSDTSSSPNYNNLQYWAAHPKKYDVSDSVPLNIKEKYSKDTLVDVFFVHPTTYTDINKGLGYNAPINNADINAKTDYSAILYQASAFNTITNVYAPRYRQANIHCYYPKNNEDSLLCINAFEMAYADVKASFLYYLNHFNKNKPFIIASHSQGTTHTKRLVKELIEGKPLQKQLVAAYLLGIVVPENYFSKIPSCDTPNQTGCYISWRTVKDDFVPAYATNEPFKATVTNPLTWSNQQPYASKELNKGTMLYNFNKIFPSITAANIKGNFLSTPKPTFFGNIFFNKKDYHIGDVNLFYINIKENVQQRIAFFNKN